MGRSTHQVRKGLEALRADRARPSGVVAPGSGQESVWDYPRPPRVEPVGQPVRVELGERTVASSSRALRVLETSHPPTIYIPLDDVDRSCLEPHPRTSFCEWKGQATYYSVSAGGRREEAAAWCYPDPNPEFAMLRDHLAFYPSRMDACWIGDERARGQAGAFYGGWITSRIVGPFKGEPGTEGW